ncbi:hypothetical protein HEB94_006641 [Actinopolymorpha pittospori]|uniref:Uncharacterized protein n=1 Tax=Actinopolymorpha pittospori TaxID=648752 RepID=A0A927N3U4_9ACTN|nr:hypothetical protein [Actinopolymorpha pittospori]
MIHTEEQYLTVELVDTTDGTVRHVWWHSERVSHDPPCHRAYRRERKGMLAPQYIRKTPKSLRHHARVGGGRRGGGIERLVVVARP